MKTRGAVLAMALLYGLGAGLSTVRAQDGNAPLVERHLALIIANEDYDLDGAIRTGPADMPPPGFLKDLANPCRDAALFHQTLLSAHWQPEEITFPGCNQTAPEMRKLITDFREKVVNSTNTLAIFYYSGHGAQFSDADTNHSFLFGVGAKLDLVALADSWRNSPRNTSAIANQAIDLDELTTPLGGQPENAVFIILDACRNNPLYGQIDELANAPPIAALGAQLDFSGILIAYSSPHGEFSGDGFGDHSIFTFALAQELRPSRNLDSSLNSLRKVVDAKYRLAYPQRTNSQIPVMTGRFNGDWCLTQCDPQVSGVRSATPAHGNLSPARDPDTELAIRKSGPAIQRATFSVPSLRASLGSSAPSIVHATARRVVKNAMLQIAEAVPTQASPASQASASTRIIYDKDANKTDYSVPASSGMHFDVFWCDGGDGSSDREKHALDIASALGQEARALQTDTPPMTNSKGLQINHSITSVRLRRLTAAANTTPGFRYSDNLIIYDKTDANEVAWSQVVSKFGGPDLNLYGDTAKTPNYMSIFVCRAPQTTKAKTLIYLQVPADNLKPSGRQLLKDITHLLPNVKNAGGIETRRDGPMSTELRFYNEEERDSAFATAKAMEQILERTVKVQFIPRLATARTAGHMEIWIGKEDLPLDEKMPKTISPKNEPKE